MCGIAGLYRQHGAVQESLLAKMASTLRHRGPDDHGIYRSGSLGMAHTRLSIIDLAHGRQPLLTDDGSLALVANGEIYNYIELRAELERDGFGFATNSDCEVILHGYRRDGLDFLSRLNGMFAFALFDRTRDTLLLVRDRLGIKPLFISEQAAGVAFGSEIKALLPALERREIDPAGLAQYLNNQFHSGRTTILHGVERVAPGEALLCSGGRVQKRWRYWSALQVQPADISADDAREQFSQLMTTVMREHMRADVPFGLFLSGGIDSGTLLGLLSRYRDEPIRTFSVGFRDTTMATELSTAGAIAQRYGCQHTELHVDREMLLNHLPFTVWAADDLMRDHANLPTSLLAQRAGEELKIVFSGEGGDEVFAGYGRYRSYGFQRAIKQLVKPGSGGFRTSGALDGGWYRRLLQPHAHAAYDRTRQPFVDAWSQTPEDWSDLQRMQFTDLVTSLPDNLLVKADRTMMAWGLEGRVPYLDHRVVEFGLSLPDGLKVRGRQGKAFLRDWAADFLLPEQLSAAKKGFSVPVSEWLQGELLRNIEQTLPRLSAIKAWFRTDGIQALIARQRKQGDQGALLWGILQFALWHQLFIDGDGERPDTAADPVAMLSAELEQAVA